MQASIKPEAPYAPEQPILSQNEDQLGRTSFAARLASSLLTPDRSRASGVVIGVTGAWGSGKSSLLNLVAEKLRKENNKAIVLRFDPWLISTRDDLVRRFIADLSATLRKSHFDDAANLLSRYQEGLFDAADALVATLDATVGLPAWVKEPFKYVRSIAKRQPKDASIYELRDKTSEALKKVGAPIIALVDEIDRLDNDEIRTIAQLVRSVADFPSLSFVLAYDADRVAEALGTAFLIPGEDPKDRGRQYLEKIVQIQIALPYAFREEIGTLLDAAVERLSVELLLPSRPTQHATYRELRSVLLQGAITTPRDVKRTIGTYHVLRGMVGDLVDWADLIGFAALSVKAPATIANMRISPDAFVHDPLEVSESLRRSDRQKLREEDILKEINPGGEADRSILTLLRHLFPAISPARPQDPTTIDPDRLQFRRPLLTVLRLGLIPGDIPLDRITAILTSQSATFVEQALRQAASEGTIVTLIDRIEDIYAKRKDVQHSSFWFGVAAFLKKPDSEWLRSDKPERLWARAFADLLINAVRRNPDLRGEAAQIFRNLFANGDTTVMPMLLRHHHWVFGLFGAQKRQHDEDRAFLSERQTSDASQQVGAGYRNQHLKGELLQNLYDLQAPLISADVGAWDGDCREMTNRLIAEDAPFDHLLLMFFGSTYAADPAGVEKICSAKFFAERLQERLKMCRSDGSHGSLVAAMDKAADFLGVTH